MRRLAVDLSESVARVERLKAELAAPPPREAVPLSFQWEAIREK